MKGVRILVVDDEPGIRQVVSPVCLRGRRLRRRGDGRERRSTCLAELARQSYELALLDIWLPGIDGLETLTRIQEIPAADRPSVVMISGHGNIETAVRATKLGAFDFLEKPLSIEKVTVVSANAVKQRRLELENSRLHEISKSRYQIIGESVPMTAALRQQMKLMAGTNGRVLIYGESGVGKELVAATPSTRW